MKESENIKILSADIQHMLTPTQAWHYRILPYHNQTKGSLKFYISEDSENASEISSELEILFDQIIKLEKVSEDFIENGLSRYYRNNSKAVNDLQLNTESIKSDNFLQLLISEAKNLGSSDIHIEAYEDKCRIRVRIDGHLIERYSISKNDYPTLVNKIKIKSNLDISEKRLPQDGRIFFKSETFKIDIRVSVLPTLHGEKIVLRLLNNESSNININYLGLSYKELENYLECIRKPHGIILISGPTGSGKTTTLYATLKILNQERSNIITIEDPIEYTLEGINQVQLKEDIGLTFASALRSFLRQDPDVIMLGEIRDAETAHMAIRAALTGHLVLSTIHTNSAWGTISRLLDMGVPPFLLAGTLNTSVAQRLVRLLCENCKTAKPFDKNLFPRNFKSNIRISEHYVASGCGYCHQTGYKGRKALYEVIPIDHDLAENIKTNTFNIDSLLQERDIKTLKENALNLFEKGLTSIEEIYPILINTH
jgi:general secretion pathway protein E/type IV pilus assembly protein PilB